MPKLRTANLFWPDIINNMYNSRGNQHQVNIGDSIFWVDSNQEEKLIRWLEANGFHGKWRRPEEGIQVGLYRYTPDVEISIQTPDGMTIRAIVESKPTMAHLGEKQKLAMRKTAKFYHTNVLLLYTHDFKSWQSIDIKTGEVLSDSVPNPGKIPIDKLYRPLTRKGAGAWNHTYRQRLELGRRSLLFTLDMVEKGLSTFVRSLMPAMKTTRRRKRRKR
ncbi:MAG: hypothetical protein UY35_C0014G0015 [Candidatus Saccharibacteria bacterium GW2011_GWC2_48_9]|nr:MAG: hypothetical protein UY35_C0014G0015 [Candidatus Saccharibacteria bacterium GW2011_GWC2_48_9]HCH33927.1 hypothetical protein [Candidatus Saccharibacteria bacterium]